jgi:hypothetical protein
VQAAAALVETLGKAAAQLVFQAAPEAVALVATEQLNLMKLLAVPELQILAQAVAAAVVASAATEVLE